VKPGLFSSRLGPHTTERRGGRSSTDGEADQNPSMGAMPRRAGAMNGMKHVPASVISSARIRDLLELDNVAQGCVGIAQRGSVCRHSASAVFAEFERALIQERIRAGIARPRRVAPSPVGPSGARRSITPGGFKSRRCCATARHPQGRTNDRLRKRRGRQDQARDKSRSLILYAIEQKGRFGALIF
jgi:hypothetical protein